MEVMSLEGIGCGVCAGCLLGETTERVGRVFEEVEGVVVTGPAKEACICESWRWVPGPDMYLEAGPRERPGKAIEGRAMGWGDGPGDGETDRDSGL